MRAAAGGAQLRRQVALLRGPDGPDLTIAWVFCAAWGAELSGDERWGSRCQMREMENDRWECAVMDGDMYGDS